VTGRRIDGESPFAEKCPAS